MVNMEMVISWNCAHMRYSRTWKTVVRIINDKSVTIADVAEVQVDPVKLVMVLVGQL